jgi:hypothetical protein
VWESTYMLCFGCFTSLNESNAWAAGDARRDLTAADMRHILQQVAASVARCNDEVYLCAYVGDWGWFHEAPLSPARHLPRRHFDQLNVMTGRGASWSTAKVFSLKSHWMSTNRICFLCRANNSEVPCQLQSQGAWERCRASCSRKVHGILCGRSVGRRQRPACAGT